MDITLMAQTGTDELERLEHDIRARHAALVRMFKEKHDPKWSVPIISTTACDCIQTVMIMNGYSLAFSDRSDLNLAGWSKERGMGRWEKVAR